MNKLEKVECIERRDLYEGWGGRGVCAGRAGREIR